MESINTLTSISRCWVKFRKLQAQELDSEKGQDILAAIGEGHPFPEPRHDRRHQRREGWHLRARLRC
ncbi:hypothetical protein A1O1_02346 [Capronia coronata CBS 617.96]|uniref:Uncharacterized protein n=1 Tax=Capronia coronata CBS 617.96 TaxID=1182541 RepID=W9YN41_9EURO|nr:uncharacterized protein A1O1_02346 [Capronia coronata CBS 617.96]EXJ93953.1 hypothetical protein A1O1_02346 [Capronia coronata CBS 617.96]